MYICGAPDLTYGRGALPPELQTEAFFEATTLDPGMFGIHPVSPLFAPIRYRWELAIDTFLEKTEFTDGLTRFYNDVSQKTCPSSVLFRIDGATVIRNVVTCRAGDDWRILYETCRDNDRAAIRLPEEAELARADGERFADDGWNALYIGSAGSFNYGHWLVDDLPRARAAAILIMKSEKPLRVILPSYGRAIDEIRVESLHLMLRSKVHVDFVDPNVAYHFPSVYYASPVTHHPLAKSPIAMDYVARETASALSSGASIERDGLARRIFVTRDRRYGRNLINEREIASALGERDYDVVRPDEMSFEEQAATFSQASVVIGLMGASMTNTLFCRPTTPVIHLAPDGWIEPFYFDLAMTRGHRYHVLYGKTEESDRDPHLRDFEIDQDLLTRFIDNL